MKLRGYRSVILPAVLMASLAGLLVAQTTPETSAQSQRENASPGPAQKMLVVNGREIPNAVAEVGGHYYVSVDSLAQITSGSLTIEPNRIVLVTQNPAAAAPPEGTPQVPPGMTRDFARAALSALAYMREWKAALATVVNFGVPVVGTWPDDYRERVQESLAQAQVAAMSNEDRQSLSLLQNEAGNLTAWSSQVISARQSMNAEQNVNPNALANDVNYQKISRCAEFLNGMLGSGVFADDPSCH